MKKCLRVIAIYEINKMLSCASQKRLLKQVYKLGKCFSSAVPGLDEEYTSAPHYPQILDITPEKKRERKKLETHETIKAVKTVEEKQIKINMPKYYGYKTSLFFENQIPYNTLPLVQHVTRTHLIECSDLPDFYNNLNVDSLFEQIKLEIEEAILFQHSCFRRKSKLLGEETTVDKDENALAVSTLQQINRIIFNRLSESYPHIRTAQVS